MSLQWSIGKNLSGASVCPGWAGCGLLTASLGGGHSFPVETLAHDPAGSRLVGRDMLECFPLEGGFRGSLGDGGAAREGFSGEKCRDGGR
jgi:hypothetical protein